MKKIQLEEVLPLEVYSQKRRELLQRWLAEKKERRLELGPTMSIAFENRRTVLAQIQEMIYIEKTTDPKVIAEMVEIYNAQVPGRLETSATLFIELRSEEELLDIKTYRGVAGSVYLHIGNEMVKGTPEEKRETEDTVSTVQYLRFRYTPQQVEAIKHGDPVSVEVVHPLHHVLAPMTATVARAVLADLLEGDTD